MMQFNGTDVLKLPVPDLSLLIHRNKIVDNTMMIRDNKQRLQQTQHRHSKSQNRYRLSPLKRKLKKV